MTSPREIVVIGQPVTCWPAESDADPVPCDFAPEGIATDAGEALLGAVNALQRNGMGNVGWKGGVELVGEGRHTRVVVAADRFSRRIAAKARS